MVKKKKANKASRKIAKKTTKKVVKNVKKVAKKKVVKKISKQKRGGVKKVTSKKRGKKVLVIAAKDKCFWVNQGPVLKNLLELHDTLLEINEDQFKHHVNKVRNDFADWVEGVLQDEKTALQIKKTKTKNSMLSVVKKALKDYKI